MFTWLKSFFSPRGPRQSASSQVAKPARLEDLLKAPGKACSEALLSFAKSASIDEFTDAVSCPALVGSAIRDGQIGQPPESGQGTSSFQTFIFTSSQVDAMVKGQSIEQSIFLLRKDPIGRTSTNYKQFEIGRSKESDIRIVDFAISRTHARIDIQGKDFTIRDSNSRNGTKVNQLSISAHPLTLKDGDTITLGRYEFTFLMPKSLYLRLRGRNQR